MANNIIVLDIKPKNISVQPTSAVFKSSTVMYSQSNIQYSQAGVFYGGSDRINGGKPNNIIVTDATQLSLRNSGLPLGPGFFLYITQ